MILSNLTPVLAKAASEGYGVGSFSARSTYLIEAVLDAAKTCGAVVTAEEHQLAGGLFGAVSETLVQHSPVPMEAVAVRDTFGESGAPEVLMDAYGLNAKAIVQAVRRVLARKG